MVEPYQSSRGSSIGGRPKADTWRGVAMEDCRRIALAICLIGVGAVDADAATWSRAYVRSLPDSAFAAVEGTQDGGRLRHLPHHDASGRLDPPHLCNALVRVSQVAWRDPAHRAAAQRHLITHRDELGADACRPGSKQPR